MAKQFWRALDQAISEQGPYRLSQADRRNVRSILFGNFSMPGSVIPMTIGTVNSVVNSFFLTTKLMVNYQSYLIAFTGVILLMSLDGTSSIMIIAAIVPALRRTIWIMLRLIGTVLM